MEMIAYLPFESDLHLPADDVRAILRISRETCEMGEEFTLRAEHRTTISCGAVVVGPMPNSQAKTSLE